MKNSVLTGSWQVIFSVSCAAALENLPHCQQAITRPSKNSSLLTKMKRIKGIKKRSCIVLPLIPIACVFALIAAYAFGVFTHTSGFSLIVSST